MLGLGNRLCLGRPGASQPSWSPADRLDEILWWFRADAGVLHGIAPNIEAADGETVRRILAQGESNGDANQTVGAKQGIYRTNRINGLPAIHLDGVDDSIQLLTASLFDGAYSLYFVFRYLSGEGTAISWDNYPTTPRHALGYKPAQPGGDPYARLEAYVNGTGQDTNGGARATAGDVQLLNVVRNGVNITGYVNGTSTFNLVVGASGTTSTPNFRIGAHYYSGSDNEFTEIDFAELVVFNTAHTSEQRAQMEAYLSRWL